MKKKQKNLRLRVFFNASVILAGLGSPSGGSGMLLKYVKKGKIIGIVSEIVVDEAQRHSDKIRLSSRSVDGIIRDIFDVIPATEKVGTKYQKYVHDIGDIHLFVSSEQSRADYLVSLDKKHVLSLSGKFNKFKIVSPGELLALL